MNFPSDGVLEWMVKRGHETPAAVITALDEFLSRCTEATNESETEMNNSLWYLWMAFMVVFLVSPVGYGWSYRGWGPPLPRYIQRRRAIRASYTDVAAAARHQAWGRGGDFVWVVMLIGGSWAAGLLLL